MPIREFSNAQELEACLGDTKQIIIDGFENLAERPEGYENQKVKYSPRGAAERNQRIPILPCCSVARSNAFIT